MLRFCTSLELRLALVVLCALCIQSDGADPQGLINEEGESGAGFGNTFAGNDRWIVAGVGTGDYQTEDGGYALLYRRKKNKWRLVDGLVDEASRAGDRFGWRVAVADSTILVAALSRVDDELTRLKQETLYGGDQTVARSGAIFAFERKGKGWAQRQLIQPDQRWDDDQFGYALAASDNRLLVGSPKASTQNRHSGAAYLFERNPGGVWIQRQRLVAGDGAPTEPLGPSATSFGWSVDLDGDRAVVGTPYGGGLTREFYNQVGSAYVFEADPASGQFVQTQLLGHEDPVRSEKFGQVVAIAGDWILVGSEGGARKHNPGFVRAFRRGADGVWALEQVLQAADAQHHDRFGYQIAMDGDRALISAIWEDGGRGDPASATGTVYLFRLDSDGDTWEQAGLFRSPDRRKQDFFGMGLFIGPGYYLLGSAALDGIHGARARDIGAFYVFDSD